MQESLEVTLPSKQEEDEKDQPAEMEYLNSRCVLFTYFQGDIGSVVDEHFSRALSQASSFNPETALTKSKAGLSPLWRGKKGEVTCCLWCSLLGLCDCNKYCIAAEILLHCEGGKITPNMKEMRSSLGLSGLVY